MIAHNGCGSGEQPSLYLYDGAMRGRFVSSPENEEQTYLKG